MLEVWQLDWPKIDCVAFSKTASINIIPSRPCKGKFLALLEGVIVCCYTHGLLYVWRWTDGTCAVIDPAVHFVCWSIIPFRRSQSHIRLILSRLHTLETGSQFGLHRRIYISLRRNTTPSSFYLSLHCSHLQMLDLG